MPREQNVVPALSLAAGVRDRLRYAACAAYPGEACGALVGSSGEGSAEVREIVPLPNRAGDEGSAFEIEPAELEPLLRRQNVIGFYHSHPDSPPVPSTRDARAAWPAYWYVIVGAERDGAGEVTAWRDGRRACLETPRSR